MPGEAAACEMGPLRAHILQEEATPGLTGLRAPSGVSWSCPLPISSSRAPRPPGSHANPGPAAQAGCKHRGGFYIWNQQHDNNGLESGEMTGNLQGENASPLPAARS